MRLIDLSDAKGQIRVEFGGCNMKCPYCVHIHQPVKEWTVDEVLDYAQKSTTENVYLGGAEPTLQKDLMPLIEGLHGMGKQVILKSNGMKPDVLEKSLPFVYGFVLEIKAPGDDVKAVMEVTGMSEERTQKYLKLLGESMNIAKQKWLRVWIRVIPEYVNAENMPRILPDLEGASEVMLYQFMSNPDFDLSFMGHDSPTPSWNELKELGNMVLEKVPQVRLVGERGKLVLTK
ncbi:pyruvate-formate lyase-activating enzyme [Methanolobus tindarius DSM 2278]|jgi:pyruvate formate lyase activating enzyme|uniref:Pyruvate-formate lyase-activating enzyme n=1 Tax=Methanolobus tindarius DSM 2278 TaxID=1090322 RepID=W9DUV1_METTI|nr:radical SAM protein [Methanolobus tindarius]ETA67196.1 pyruvate-formate lyase-activating enzyme [Methanolobus tindarius DSM 2278]